METDPFANWQKEAGPQTRKDDALGAQCAFRCHKMQNLRYTLFELYFITFKYLNYETDYRKCK